MLLKHSESIEQTCEIRSGGWNIPYYDRLTTQVYSCHIFGAQILNENEPVTTKILGHTKLNSEVQGVYYASGKIKIIPSSIFSGFINLEYFFIEAGQSFEVIRPDSFRNCRKLKVIWIRGNEITRLDDNLFLSATTLEYINLQNNKILSIHRLAFNKLTKVKRIILSGNKITNLFPETFSSLIGLLTLDLSSNNCVDMKIENCNTKFREVEVEIRKLCSYSLTQKEILEIEKERRDFRLEQQQKIKLLERLTENLTNTLKDHGRKIINLTDTIEKMTENQSKSNIEIQQEVIKFEVELQISKVLLKFNQTESESEDISTDELKQKDEFNDINKKLNNLELKLSSKISEDHLKLSEIFDNKILLTENKFSNNYLMLLKSIQDQKSFIDMSLNLTTIDNIKICRKEISVLQDKMQKVGESLDKRLKMIEKKRTD